MKNRVDTTKARLYYRDGTVKHYEDQKLARQIWLATAVGAMIAFRAANDSEPVYVWEYLR